MMKKIIFMALLTLVPLKAAALELSLEENKGESGTVGYVDIDRVFKEYSGTLNAREDFLGEIKKKEGAVTERKRVIYVLKADIAKLRQEREFALTLPGLLATQEQLNSARSAAAAPQTGAAAPAAAPAEVSASSAALVQGSTAPASALSAVKTSQPVQGSTAAVSVQSAVNAAPSVQASTAPVPAQPVKAAPSALTVAISTSAPPPPRPLMNASLNGGLINLPGISNVPMNYFKFSVSTSVPDIDSAITVKEADLKQKDESLKLYQRQVESELLEYESHRSEILLGRIYLALKELAIKEGVSVVIDKRNILFGHSAVDLTDKLLKQMEETP